MLNDKSLWPLDKSCLASVLSKLYGKIFSNKLTPRHHFAIWFCMAERLLLFRLLILKIPAAAWRHRFRDTPCSRRTFVSRRSARLPASSVYSPYFLNSLMLPPCLLPYDIQNTSISVLHNSHNPVCRFYRSGNACEFFCNLLQFFNRYSLDSAPFQVFF